MTIAAGTQLGRYEIRSKLCAGKRLCAGRRLGAVQTTPPRCSSALFSRWRRVFRKTGRMSRYDLPVTVAFHPYVRDAQFAFDIHSLDLCLGSNSIAGHAGVTVSANL